MFLNNENKQESLWLNFSKPILTHISLAPNFGPKPNFRLHIKNLLTKTKILQTQATHTIHSYFTGVTHEPTHLRNPRNPRTHAIHATLQTQLFYWDVTKYQRINFIIIVITLVMFQRL